jgi:hypothetical protein
MPQVAHTAQSLDIYQSDGLFRDGADADLQAWTDAKNKYSGVGNPLDALLEGVNKYNSTLKSEDLVAPVTFTTSAGKLQRIFADAKKQFPNVLTT